MTIALLLIINRERLNNQRKRIELRVSIKPVLEHDISRVWLSFYESYLFVHETSKMMPTNKEFIDFQRSFVDMFHIIIGPEQMAIYSEAYGGPAYFDNYLRNEFERFFKSVFMKKINEILLNKEDK